MRLRSAAIFLCLTALQAVPAWAQAPRQDYIWARRSIANITLNGVLNEPAWAQAESMVVNFGVSNGIPGSGYKYEGGVLPIDPSQTTLKFLVVGNTLYLGARVKDKSIGGSVDFNRFDGLLMAIKDHAGVGFPKLPAEYLYSWWYPTDPNPLTPGKPPGFRGTWATNDDTPRTPAQIAAWDAATVVNGTSNTDATDDVGYTVEMKFDLTVMGYDARKPQGDIVEWNVSIYDCDWLWPLVGSKLSYNRVWWQSPWGNAYWYDEVHIFVRPDVTTNSGALPTVRPEVYIPSGQAFAAPAIDGTPNEAVWNTAYTFDIKYNDDARRLTYPGVGPSRSGQFQPVVNGTTAPVVDPGDATVKMFHRDNDLYLSFNVRDAYVQFHPAIDRWDGFLITINDRAVLGPDNELRGRRLSCQVGPGGVALPQDYLSTLVGLGGASVAMHMNAGTTVDTLGVPDNGYTAEVKLDLTKFGYPAGLGDRALFIGVNLLDGDSFDPFTDSYGERTWWFREFEGQCCPAWAHLATSPPTDAGGPEQSVDASTLIGAFPVPGVKPSIRYSLAQRSAVVLHVFDVTGRLVERRVLGTQSPGVRDALFDGSGHSAGVYMYRLDIGNPNTGQLRKSLTGRLVVLGK